jgi:hypothetical protein
VNLLPVLAEDGFSPSMHLAGENQRADFDVLFPTLQGAQPQTQRKSGS